nr:NAD(P)H-dependent oxidoreductase [Brevibacillus brevis]
MLVHQRWKEELLQYPNDITIHEIYKEYPDWNIDVPREQQLLEAYDHVIFQFPLYWYSYPPLLKKWFDDVFAYGWAYGSNGDKASFQASDEEINHSEKNISIISLRIGVTDIFHARCPILFS